MPQSGEVRGSAAEGDRAGSREPLESHEGETGLRLGAGGDPAGWVTGQRPALWSFLDGQDLGTVWQVEKDVGEMLKDRRTGRTWDGLGVARKGVEDDGAGLQLWGHPPGILAGGRERVRSQQSEAPSGAIQGQALSGAAPSSPPGPAVAAPASWPVHVSPLVQTKQPQIPARKCTFLLLPTSMVLAVPLLWHQQ